MQRTVVAARQGPAVVSVEADECVVVEPRLLQVCHHASDCPINVVDHRVVELTLRIGWLDEFRKSVVIRIGDLQRAVNNIYTHTLAYQAASDSSRNVKDCRLTSTLLLCCGGGTTRM